MELEGLVTTRRKGHHPTVGPPTRRLDQMISRLDRRATHGGIQIRGQVFPMVRRGEHSAMRVVPSRVSLHEPQRPGSYTTHNLDCRSATAGELAIALDNLKIGNEWGVAKGLRDYARLHPTVTDFGLPQGARLETPNRAFRNLIVGTIAEKLVEKKCLDPLVKAGYAIEDTRLKGDFTDYILTKDGERLPINVKVASTLFRTAKTAVGLEPEDCIPLSTYKVIGAATREPDLLFVDVVDYRLRQRVDAFVDALSGDEAIVWDMLSWYGGRGVKRAQDEFVASLFATHGPELMQLVRTADIRVVSVQKVHEIFRDIPSRCPVFSSRGNGGPTMGDPSVHVSSSEETVPWDDVAKTLLDEGISGVLTKIHHTSRVQVRRPTL